MSILKSFVWKLEQPYERENKKSQASIVLRRFVGTKIPIHSLFFPE